MQSTQQQAARQRDGAAAEPDQTALPVEAPAVEQSQSFAPPQQLIGGIPRQLFMLLLVVIGIPVATLAIMGTLALLKSLFYRPTDPNYENPRVLTGHLNWRIIGSSEPLTLNGALVPHTYKTIIAGDMDGDGTDELLVEGYGTGLEVLHLDGTACSSNLGPIGQSEAMLGFECMWDSNGDGKQEIITSTDTGSVAWDMQGRVVKTLPYSRLGCGLDDTGDADGDGHPELWVYLSTPQIVGIGAVNAAGELVLQKEYIGKFSQTRVCDYYGTGRAVCMLVDPSGELHSIGKDGVATLGKVMDLDLLAACTDINGDGQPDLINGDGSFFDHASGRLQHLPAQKNASFGYSASGQFEPFDLKGDGKREVVYVGANASIPYREDRPQPLNHLRIFQPQTGHPLYDETLDAKARVQVAVAHDHGREHLVVASDDKLLIYP